MRKHNKILPLACIIAFCSSSFADSNDVVVCPDPNTIICLKATDSPYPNFEHMYNSRSGMPSQYWTSNYYPGPCPERTGASFHKPVVGNNGSGEVTCTYKGKDFQGKPVSYTLFQTWKSSYCLYSQVYPNEKCPAQATKTKNGNDCMVYEYPSRLNCQPQ